MEEIFLEIKDRILQIPDSKGLTREDFFEKIGASYGNFKGKSKKSAIGSAVLVEILSKFPDINMEWVLTGNGSMLKKNSLDVGNQDLSLLRELIAEKDKRINELNRHIEDLQGQLQQKSNYKSKKDNPVIPTSNNG
ncbi:MAG TPA: hypothetical protein VFX43_08095 [Chitinophagaceae bacterium]|nr:hypothetical protein [Chitinophagaceae bacterium]